MIATSTAVYTEEAVTLENRLAWFRERLTQGYPVIVVCEEDAVLGFSTFGDFRAWPCYRHTVEHSVHIHRDFRGRGIGRRLVETLFPYAREIGKHVMVAGVDAENQASIGLHESLGFERVAHFREVGFKFWSLARPYLSATNALRY